VFERFTDRARRVVVLAQEESRLLNHDFIGTEHILLGLIHEGEGVAAQALGALGIRLEAVRAGVEETVGQGESTPSGHIPFTPRAKKVLELSLREALQFGHNYIGTEHLLLGLIREGEGVAATVLVGLGADLERVRTKVIEILSGGQRPQSGVGRVATQATSAFELLRSVPVSETAPSGLDGLIVRRLTVRARRVLLLAESEALRLGHVRVGSEHLLLGLLAEGEGDAATALGGLGIDLDTVRARAEQTLGRRPLGGAAQVMFEDSALDALERALVEALSERREAIDAADLLRGLVQQAERGVGLMGAALQALGTSPEAVRAALADAGDQPDADPDAGTGEP
jgi:ATP-dependent Clp protease ATP-binding subunit ClpA